jgi:ABC-type lipoprotein release transport system permease subunit
MNPLSIWTFYRRHKGRTALFLGLICLATIGSYLMAALAYGTFVEPVRTNLGLVEKFNLIGPIGGDKLDPTVVAQVQANPDVVQVVPAVMLNLRIPGLAGNSFYFGILGLQEADVVTVMTQSNVVLKEGHMLQPRTNGLLLSEETAAALDLDIGDTLHSSIDPLLFDNIVAPLEVVGLLSGDVPLAIASHEYLTGHELLQDKVDPITLIIARQGRQAIVDDFLVDEISSNQINVFTLQTIRAQLAEAGRVIYIFGVPISLLVAIAITLVIGAINQITLTQRLPEFGILHAAGYRKQWLIRHLTLETTILTGLGWILGLASSWLILYGLKIAVYTPRGQTLNLVQGLALALSALIPVVIIGFTFITTHRIFSRLDTVAIVEQSELSMEKEPQQTPAETLKNISSPKPLSAIVYYQRHKRRTSLLVGSMVLLIMAVSLLIFILTVLEESNKSHRGRISRMSIVYSLDDTRVPSGVTALIKSHSAVDRVMPSFEARWLYAYAPPFGTVGVRTYAVSAQDMVYVAKLYDLTLTEGHWPRPRTNDIIISEAFARNQNLKIGDILDNRAHPAYSGREPMPFELKISGIYAPRPTTPDNRIWSAFMSLEFVASFLENPAMKLLVAPKAGQKVVLDDWLENEVANRQIGVQTYRQKKIQDAKWLGTIMLTIALIEVAIAIVAALALVGLNYIFVAQRRSEFGLLHALGFQRLRLVGRALRETVFTTGAAWSISLILSLIGLVYLQFAFFIPKGLHLNFFNPLPWLFTVPIPVAVLLVTTGTTAWMLSRLDPVSTIERRA